MDITTGRSKNFAMVIRLTLNPRTKTRRLLRIFPSPSVIIGEVSSLVSSSRPDKVTRAWFRQLFVGTCILAFSVNIEAVSAAALVSRHTFQTSDGVSLSILETRRQTWARHLTYSRLVDAGLSMAETD